MKNDSAFQDHCFVLYAHPSMTDDVLMTSLGNTFKSHDFAAALISYLKKNVCDTIMSRTWQRAGVSCLIAKWMGGYLLYSWVGILLKNKKIGDKIIV